jgi:hypothetical protein
MSSHTFSSIWLLISVLVYVTELYCYSEIPRITITGLPTLNREKGIADKSGILCRLGLEYPEVVYEVGITSNIVVEHREN